MPSKQIRFPVVVDKHVDAGIIKDEIPNAVVTSAATQSPRMRYKGERPEDEDRRDFLQLTFERDATGVTADGDITQKARNFGPCGSNNHWLWGIIQLPVGKTQQVAALRAFKDGSLRVRGVRPGDFEEIAESNLGVNLCDSAPVAIELCDCKTPEQIDRHRQRYKRK